MISQKRLFWLTFSFSVAVGTGYVGVKHADRIRAMVLREPAQEKLSAIAKGELKKESFQMLIQGKLAEVQECYNAQLRQGLRREGKLVIKWAVDAKGQSSQFTEELNELNSTELYDCTTTAIESWNFPKNHPTFIRYTFKMRALPQQKIIHEVSDLNDL